MSAFRDVARHLLPYQQRWLGDDRSVCVAEKSRRIGWTYVSACRAVYRRLALRTNLFYTSADLTAAREFVEDCHRWARVFNACAQDVGWRQIEDEGLTALSLRFNNGARIVAGSSNPKFFRSKGGDVDADEFAFHEQPHELYKAMQPSALMWGHQMRIWSTHNGAGSFFHRLVQSALNTATSYSSASADVATRVPPIAPITNQRIGGYRVTLTDAVQQGLVERIRGLSAPDLAARRDFVDDIRASCPDEASFREEYLCEPSAEGSALLGYSAIGGCEVANLQLHDIEALADGVVARLPHATTGPLFAGFDVGRKHDRSVLWVLERVGDVLWTRAVRVMGDAPFTTQEQLLDRLLQGRRVRRLCIDSTGIGAMLAERLAHRHAARVEAIHFTSDVKSELAMPLVRLFQERLVRIPADPAIREDLHKVRRSVTASHHVRLTAPRDADGHADRFWALALAAHAAAQTPANAGASQARKPVGW